MTRSLTLLLALAGCGASSDHQPTSQEDKSAVAEEDADGWYDDAGAGGMPGAPPPEPEAAAAPMPASTVGRGRRAKKEKSADRSSLEQGNVEGVPGGAKNEGDAARTRSWFPETFLWEPSLQTDARGQATVDVRVPDRLTDWRVLALAHSRDGGIAGATTSLRSSLPLYIDPVVPPFLVQGDRARLPVQVVNTTATAQTARLDIRATGAASVSTTGSVTVPAGATRVVWTDLVAARAGPVTLAVSLSGADAVSRTFSVEPAGRPITLSRGGTLAAPRDLSLLGPPGLDPDSARVRLAVYPGALAVVRQELATAGDRGGLQGTAYALLLSGEGPALLTRLGQPVSAEGADPEARRIAENLRSMRLRATARAAGLARTPSLSVGLSLAGPALAHPDDPMLARLGDRLLGQLAQTQRPDGTFGGDDGGRWTLQRLLVATAQATRAADAAAAAPGAPADVAARGRVAQRIGLQASAAFERNGAQVTDGYTAAAMLASGATSGALADRLEALVLDAIDDRPDGTRVLPVPAGVTRFDGTTPSTLEATALATLALQGRADPAVVSDLGAAVLAGWRPGAGWGDGATDLVALQAVLALFSDPLPDAVTVTLSRDGVPVSSRTLDAAALRDLAVIDVPAPGAAGAHTWSVSAEPAVPGLGFDLALQAWVPWLAAAPAGGLELDVAVPEGLRLGRRADLRLTAAAPAGRPIVLSQGFPAGVQVDTEALDRLVASGELRGFSVEDGRVRLELPALAAAQTARLVVPVTPTLSGTLHAGAATLQVEDRDDLSVTVPPAAWRIGG